MSNDFGGQLYTGGKVLITPQYTPMVLVMLTERPVPDTPQNNYLLDIKTNIPNGRSCAVFFRGTNTLSINDGGPNLEGGLLTIEDGSDGFVHIKLTSRMRFSGAGITNTIRFYIFSNFVPNVPEWGIYYYRDGIIVYTQNCLPLYNVLFYDRSHSPGSNVAVMGGYEGIHSFLIGPNFYRYQETVWSANIYGIGRYIYYATNGTPGGSEYASAGVHYIKTDVYDQYYQQALGGGS